ncbi:EG45-like domain containing protein [Neltuma alba]|uniref:EG45-like domain containing protein n=1 Tax=Neltuma alba TaxID=207710 RepID=UPI0010A59F0E|nr:EG45-like domain containing protein [Prosopis alba]
MGFAIASLFAAASAASGTATFYTEYVPSACYGYQDQGTMIAAAGDSLWNNGAACGKRYRIRCTGGTNQGVAQPCRSGTVTVKIVDRCPSPGCQATIDLSRQAFAAIADPDEGKIRIEYTQV